MLPRPHLTRSQTGYLRGKEGGEGGGGLNALPGIKVNNATNYYDYHLTDLIQTDLTLI